MHLVGAPPPQEHTQGTGAVVCVVGYAQRKILVEALQLKGYYSGLFQQLCTTQGMAQLFELFLDKFEAMIIC